MMILVVFYPLLLLLFLFFSYSSLTLILFTSKGYWTISWGALNIFNVSNTDAGDNLKTEEARLFAVAHGVCYSISSFVELVILLLLCSSSIGKNNFNRSWLVAR